MPKKNGYSAKQKKLAKLAAPFDKLDAKDFEKLRDSRRRNKSI